MKLSSHCIILCPTLCNLMDCSPPGSSVHGLFQAKILAWVAISSSKESSGATGQTWISCVSWIAGGSFYHWAIREAPISGYDIHVINGDVKLEHLVKVESARFLHITIFPFHILLRDEKDWVQPTLHTQFKGWEIKFYLLGEEYQRICGHMLKLPHLGEVPWGNTNVLLLLKVLPTNFTILSASCS